MHHLNERWCVFRNLITAKGKKVGVGEHHWYKNSSLLAVVGTGECVIIVGQFFKLARKTLHGSEALMKGLKKIVMILTKLRLTQTF